MAGFGGFAYLRRGARDENHHFDFVELPKGEISRDNMLVSRPNSQTNPLNFVSAGEKAKL
jgi:hypothetical protein